MLDRSAFLVMSVAWTCAAALAEDVTFCVYNTEDGRTIQVSSPDDVPAAYRSAARCFRAQKNSSLAKPEAIALGNNLRQEYINSAIGPITLRWPRAVETLFGRTPVRAMGDAAQTVSRALRQGSFLPQIQNLHTDWSVVFLGDKLGKAEIPAYLKTSCHPGWMTPPANIYIVASRVAGGCNGGTRSTATVADAQLAQVLIHEIGHAVEFNLLNGRVDTDLMRAEGFASWFEQYASDFSALIARGQVSAYHKANALEAMRRSPQSFSFQGSALDYSRASMFFRAIVDRRGISGLMDVYSYMTREHASFLTAVDRQLGWNNAIIMKEAARSAEN